jgi:hypothetical protein
MNSAAGWQYPHRVADADSEYAALRLDQLVGWMRVRGVPVPGGECEPFHQGRAQRRVQQPRRMSET